MRARRGLGLVLGMLAVVVAVSSPAAAQYGRRWGYPRGYGGYGWGGWGINTGVDPASGYMAGLGSYAQGMGAYEVSDAQARSINADTVVRWNKALREQQAALAAQKAQQDAQNQANLAARAQQSAVENGQTLNLLYDRILDFNPTGVKGQAAKTGVAPAVIRDIPFETASEAITVCLDQMTADDAWPSVLQGDRFAADRRAIHDSVTQALKEDAKGDVSTATLNKINEAVAKLRSKFKKATGELELIYTDADDFTKSLGGLAGMLHNPSLKQVLTDLDTYKGSTVGDLIAFMTAFNLRFAPAVSDRQRDIYNTLVPLYEQVLVDTSGRSLEEAKRSKPKKVEETSKPLQSAARQVFQGMPVPPPPAAQPPN